MSNFNPPWNKGKSSWAKGKKFSIEHKEKIRQALINNKNGVGNKGKPKSSKHRAKIGIYIRTDEIKEKTREARAKQVMPTGKNHHNWKGGYTCVYPRIFNKKLKFKIRERDGFICCLCRKTEDEERAEFNQALSVNHIDFNKNNCSEENLNTLCLRCNLKINNNREFWTNYFKEKRYVLLDA